MSTWKCPCCKQNATLTTPNINVTTDSFNNGNKHGERFVRTLVCVCPNKECQEYTLSVSLLESKNGTHKNYPGDTLDIWTLIPQSNAEVFPDYVPEAIRKDYEEACAIQELSPKASATLARRCLQGIIRGFYGESKARLVDEINAVQSRMDPLTWQAIDAIRQIGNIGAHMEKDINVIVDVEPQEANLLVGLIELLIRDTYVLKHEREQQLRAVIQLAADKTTAKTIPTTPSP